MSVRRIWTIAFLLLTLVITVTGQATAQEAVPTATAELPLTAIPDGTWLVGDEVSAGIYSAPGGAQCAWKRLSGFGGTTDDIIASDFGIVRPIVEISQTDIGFTTSDCGAWTLIKQVSTPTSAKTPTQAPTLATTPTATRTAASTAPSSPTPTARPTSAPTPTPAAKRLTGSLGSRGNPVPFSQAVRVGSWEVTVLGIVADATNDVLQKNRWNDPPEKGNQFFVVTVKAKYLGSSSARFDGDYRLRALGPSGVVYSTFENSCGVIPNELPDPELFRGGQILGAECWEIASTDADSLVMLLDPNFYAEDKRVWFSLQDATTGGKEEEPTVTAAPTPVVTIPRGWSPIVNRRLGYSFAVPRGWSNFDMQTGQLGQIIRFIDPSAAQQVDELLASPGAENAGHLAIELKIFSRPPIASLAGVGIVPLDDDIPTANVMQWLSRAIESFDTISVEVKSLALPTICPP